MFCNGNVEAAKQVFEISDEKQIRSKDLAIISFCCGTIFPLLYCILAVFIFPIGKEHYENYS